MKKEKETLSKEKIDNTPLEGVLFWQVFALNILSPVLASAIFYYGWRKKFPKKAKTSNRMGFFAFFLWVIVYKFVL